MKAIVRSQQEDPPPASEQPVLQHPVRSGSHPIRTWSQDQRPRERLWEHGPGSLSVPELLALLLGSGDRSRDAVALGKALFAHSGEDLLTLARCRPGDLAQLSGVGPAKAARVAAALELARRRMAAQSRAKPQLRCSQDVFRHVRDVLSDCPREEFWVLYANRANRLIHRERISMGGVSGTVVDLKLVFKHAVERLACGLALCHNHPSGNLRPSPADRHLTRKAVEAGRVLDVAVFDHLILADGRYFSFADEGLLQAASATPEHAAEARRRHAGSGGCSAHLDSG
jgi:DNA repair protein RadC